MKNLDNKKIALEIIDSLCDRRGFNDWWNNMDDEINEEIINEIENIIKKRLDNELEFCICGNPSEKGNCYFKNNETLIYECIDCGKEIKE